MPPVPRPQGPKGAGGDRRLTLILLVGLAAGLAVALIGGSLLLRGGDDAEPPQVTGDTALVDGLPQQGTVLGDPKAKVTLYQYEDIQCPYCLRYTVELFPIVVDEFVRTGKANVDFRGLALLGEDSTQALRAVLAAAKQGKAWQLIELFYANQGEEGSGWVTDVLVRELASSIDGLDVDKMEQDAQSQEITDEIAKVRAEAQERGVQGTPWFFVRTASGKLVELPPQNLSADTLRAALDGAQQG
jgi:protein-disulfide isomerase